MVDNVSFNGSNINLKPYSKDMETVAKYALGTTIVPEAGGPFEGFGLMFGLAAIPEAIKLGKWAYYNKQNLPKLISEDKKIIQTSLAEEQKIFKNGGWKKLSSYQYLYENAEKAKAKLETGETAAKLERAKANLSAGKASIFDRVKAFFTGKKPEEFTSKRVVKLTDKLSDVKEAEKVAGKGGIFKRIESLLNGGKAVGNTEKLLSKSGLIKGIKGNALFLAITAGVELFTKIIPAFSQLGAGAGVKQVGKSAVKTAASVGGWAAGAAVGAAVGSVIPVAGTAIGGVVGAIIGTIGGCIGSWAATKAADAIVGKDEIDIASEEEAKQLAYKAQSDSALTQQLVLAAKQRYDQEGGASEDAQIAFKSMNKIAQNTDTSVKSIQNTYDKQNSTMNTVDYSSLANNMFAGKTDIMNQDIMAVKAGYVTI